MADALHRPDRTEIYQTLHESPEFGELRHRYRSFALPYTAAFLTWYLLYVLMSNWADDFMGTKVFGNVNVALIFGLLQFVTTFGIAYLYSRHASRSLDPLAGDLEARYNAAVAKGAQR